MNTGRQKKKLFKYLIRGISKWLLYLTKPIYIKFGYIELHFRFTLDGKFVEIHASFLARSDFIWILFQMDTGGVDNSVLCMILYTKMV